MDVLERDFYEERRRKWRRSAFWRGFLIAAVIALVLSLPGLRRSLSLGFGPDRAARALGRDLGRRGAREAARRSASNATTSRR
jgi:hypothetical protein